jgi:hypothetical protein
VSFPTPERHPWMDRPEPEEQDDSAWCETCERFVPFGAEALCLVCGDDEEEMQHG